MPLVLKLSVLSAQPPHPVNKSQFMSQMVSQPDPEPLADLFQHTSSSDSAVSYDSDLDPSPPEKDV